MVTRDQAVVRASEWLGVVPEQVGAHEFDLGWVVWEVFTEDDDVLAQLIGSAKGVVAHDGSLTSWPSLPADTVAQRYRDWSASRGRFAADVEDGLYAAGWYPGRSVGEHASRWLEQLLTELGDESVVLHERARELVDEFGRIMLVQQLDGRHERLLRLYPIAFEALPVRDWRPDDRAAARLHTAGVEGELCPVGVYQDDGDLEDVLVGADGAVYAAGPSVRRIGSDVDAALTVFLTSGQWISLPDRASGTRKARRSTPARAAAPTTRTTTRSTTTRSTTTGRKGSR